MLRPAVQPGSKIDYEWPAEEVTLAFESSVQLSSVRTVAQLGLVRPQYGTRSIDGERDTSSRIATESFRSRSGLPQRLLEAAFLARHSFTRRGQPRPRRSNFAACFVPWADTKADLGKPVEIARAEGTRRRELGTRAEGVLRRDSVVLKCHASMARAATSAPTSSNLIHRDYASVLRDITQPSFAINPDYIPQTVTLNDDRVLHGRRPHRRWQAPHRRQGRQDDRSSTRPTSRRCGPSAVSVMPDDLLKKLGPEQTRDLLTFLLTPAPRMPRDYAGSEKRPKPRTIAEVNAVLAGAPKPAGEDAAALASCWSPGRRTTARASTITRRGRRRGPSCSPPATRSRS